MGLGLGVSIGNTHVISGDDSFNLRLQYSLWKDVDDLNDHFRSVNIFPWKNTSLSSSCSKKKPKHLSALAARSTHTHIRMTKCFTSSICKQHWNKLISNWCAPLCKSLKKNVFSVFSIQQTLNKTHLLVFPQQKTTQISPEIFPQQKNPRFPAKISLHFPSGRFVPTCSAVAAVKMGRLRRLMPSPQWMK